MLHEHQHAVLQVDLPEAELRVGDVGTVVHVYGNGVAYEVEFFALDGRTLGVVTVEAGQVRAVSRHDVLHARQQPA